MSDNVGYTPGIGATIAADNVGGNLHQRVKIGIGADGTATDVSAANPMPITAPGEIAVTGPLTDAQLRASAVPVADNASGNLLLRVLQMLMAPLGYDKSLGRQRGTVVVESGTINVASTVSTLTNIAGIGNYSAQMQILDGNRANWAMSVRSRIT